MKKILGNVTKNLTFGGDARIVLVAVPLWGRINVGMMTMAKTATATKRTTKPKHVHGARKDAARKIFARNGIDRPGFIAAVVKCGATMGTARVWWQQFRTA